ncbi:MAG: hypothetical protein O7C56_03275 [Rickettsia endosymbiont of Ixodes persulcatus]|nr:hypothetical protein [Rickettsia endosymbiont of Ixodes persulcatus]
MENIFGIATEVVKFLIALGVVSFCRDLIIGHYSFKVTLHKPFKNIKKFNITSFEHFIGIILKLFFSVYFLLTLAIVVIDIILYSTENNNSDLKEGTGYFIIALLILVIIPFIDSHTNPTGSFSYFTDKNTNKSKKYYIIGFSELTNSFVCATRENIKKAINSKENPDFKLFNSDYIKSKKLTNEIFNLKMLKDNNKSLKNKKRRYKLFGYDIYIKKSK